MRYRLTDPMLQAAYERTFFAMKASIIQGLLHESDPRTFPADPMRKRTFIRPGAPTVTLTPASAVVLSRYAGLTVEKREGAKAFARKAARVDRDLTYWTATRGVNLRSPKHVLEQIDLGREFSFLADPTWRRRRLSGVVDLGPKVQLHDPIVISPAIPTATVTNQALRFRLHRVTCIDETGEGMGEWGSDEIAMGGTTTDPDGTTGAIGEFEVGSFDDGTVRDLPPRIVATFGTAGSYSQARVWTVWLAMAEKDAGGFSDFLQKMYEAIKVELQVILSAAGAAAGALIGAQIGGTVGSAVAGPIGTIIGVVAGLLLGALVGWLVEVLRDDIFPPLVTSVALPSPDATFANGSLTSEVIQLTFDAHDGQYVAEGSWEIVR